MNVQLDPQRNDSTVELASEWSPAYEFLVSFGCFAFASLHPILEIGQSWVRQVRHSRRRESFADLALPIRRLAS